MRSESEDISDRNTIHNGTKNKKQVKDGRQSKV